MSEKRTSYDILIIGGGTAGLTAAIYGVRAGHSVLVFEEISCGGQILTTPEIDNYPALEKISGFDFSQQLCRQAKELGIKVAYEQVTEIRDFGTVKEVTASSGDYQAKAIIIANGAKNAELGCKNELEFKGRGVSYCAACDGAFFQNKTVAVVGGGNTALENALFLSQICRKVYLIHRGDALKGEAKMMETVLQRENTEPIYNTVVESINGTDFVTFVTLKNLISGQITELATDGVFVSIGHKPDNARFSHLVDLDDHGYIIAGEDCKTSRKGFFAAGDTRTKSTRQLTTAAADGSVAALAASAYIQTLF